MPKYLNLGGDKDSYSRQQDVGKSIKDHPIVVGASAQWLVSNSGRKEAIYANIMDTKLKDKVDELSSLSASSSNSNNELNISVAYSKKSVDTAISKLGSFSKK